MNDIATILQGKSLADYTNSQLRLALGAVLYTNTADMWKQYLNKLGYTGTVAGMLQKYFVDYQVPMQFRNYINAGAGVFGSFNPTTLFSDGSKGVLYDNNDLSSFYLDSAGTTPATVNGLVGLQLDKSQGLALGAETVVDGGFDTGTGWTAGTGWTISGGVASASGATADGLRNSSAAYTTGKWYLVSFDKTGGATATVYVRGNSPAVTTSASGRISLYMLAGSTARGVEFYLNGAGTIDNVSVVEIQGNHRYQTTTGSKPILRGTPVGGNRVLNGDFSDGGNNWVPGTAGIVTFTGGQAVWNATTNSNLRQNGRVSGGRWYRVRYQISSYTSGNIRFGFVGGTGTLGATRSANGVYEEYLQNPDNSDFYFIANFSSGFVGAIDNIEIHDVSADSVTAPYGLQFDGFDDFLFTAAVDFSATDKMGVCMGVRKLSDAGVGMLVEHSADWNANNGTFNIQAPPISGSARYYFGNRGTIQSNATVLSGYAAPITSVLTGVGDISGDSTILRINGAVAQSVTTDLGAGNYANASLYFGRRGGTSLPFSGLDFGGIIVGKALTAAQLASVERWVAQRTGVTL